ncbi:MAG: hypothetical protein VYD57_19270 [Pseudomonadota bacterium]|nr:hypothetical protein [Pseudomonadota bacterium]
MHRGHDDHFHPYDMPHGHMGAGHNAQATAQWQVPHEHHAHGGEPQDHHHEADFDLVEKAFAEGFYAASDPTSFLRLAGVPFRARTSEGTDLSLLRVEETLRVDTGSLAPHLGGGSFRYDPLPAAMISKRRALAFQYFDGSEVRTLSLEEARGLDKIEP